MPLVSDFCKVQLRLQIEEMRQQDADIGEFDKEKQTYMKFDDSRSFSELTQFLDVLGLLAVTLLCLIEEFDLAFSFCGENRVDDESGPVPNRSKPVASVGKRRPVRWKVFLGNLRKGP